MDDFKTLRFLAGFNNRKSVADFQRFFNGGLHGNFYILELDALKATAQQFLGNVV